MTDSTDEAADAALWTRIERALGAVEAAVRALPADPVSAHAGLVARHDGLRAAVATAVGRIDRLIAAQAGTDDDLPLAGVFDDPASDADDAAGDGHRA